MIDAMEIALDQLPWVPLKATNGFPEDPAVYFAIDALGQVQYIGKSINVRTRWKNHHKYKELAAIDGVKIAYMFVDASESLIQIESALIQKFLPPLNIAGKKVKKPLVSTATPQPKKPLTSAAPLLDQVKYEFELFWPSPVSCLYKIKGDREWLLGSIEEFWDDDDVKTYKVTCYPSRKEESFSKFENASDWLEQNGEGVEGDRIQEVLKELDLLEDGHD